VPVSLTVSPLQDRHGNFLGTILVLRDLKHQASEDLKRADRFHSRTWRRLAMKFAILGRHQGPLVAETLTNAIQRSRIC
jgi:hypothetical protein